MKADDAIDALLDLLDHRANEGRSDDTVRHLVYNVHEARRKSEELPPPPGLAPVARRSVEVLLDVIDARLRPFFFAVGQVGGEIQQVLRAADEVRVALDAPASDCTNDPETCPLAGNGPWRRGAFYGHLCLRPTPTKADRQAAAEVEVSARWWKYLRFPDEEYLVAALAKALAAYPERPKPVGWLTDRPGAFGAYLYQSLNIATTLPERTRGSCPKCSSAAEAELWYPECDRIDYRCPNGHVWTESNTYVPPGGPPLIMTTDVCPICGDPAAAGTTPVYLGKPSDYMILECSRPDGHVWVRPITEDMPEANVYLRDLRLPEDP